MHVWVYIYLFKDADILLKNTPKPTTPATGKKYPKNAKEKLNILNDVGEI